MSESLGSLIDHVDSAQRRLRTLSVASTRSPEAACQLGRSVSVDIARHLGELADETPAAQAAARAAGERFDSHVLAATLLEASDASVASVFELIGRGLIGLRADVERLARTRRLPA